MDRVIHAIDDTQLLDIKPHMIEVGPRTPVRQPEWVGELMADHWQAGRLSHARIDGCVGDDACLGQRLEFVGTEAESGEQLAVVFAKPR